MYLFVVCFATCKVLFRFALAVFKLNEEQILKIEDSTGIFNFMRQVPERIADHHLLMQVIQYSVVLNIEKVFL